jgi:hypothetical protein
MLPRCRLQVFIPAVNGITITQKSFFNALKWAGFPVLQIPDSSQIRHIQRAFAAYPQTH